MNATDFRPLVWIGCLACYNNGNLTGEWAAALEAEACTPCTLPGHEEWWVLDHEGFHGALDGECSPAEAQHLAVRLGELFDRGPEFAAAVIAEANCQHDDITNLDVDDYLDRYAGTADTITEWAWEFLTDTHGLEDLPDWVSRGAVVDAWLNDARHNGLCSHYTDHGIAVFHN